MSNFNWEKIHSVLFVPASKKRLNHIPDIEADAFIIDLEDSIKEGMKDIAYQELTEWLDEGYDSKLEKNLILRINKSRVRTEAELFSNKTAIKCIAIPKVESADDIRAVTEAFPQKDIFVLIENPKGLIKLQTILQEQSVNAVGFGGEDFCVSMRMKKKNEYLIPIKSQLLMYSKVLCKPAFDMIEAEYSDLNKLENYALMSKEMGFDGKLAIHPAQIKVINSLFHDFETDKAKNIIAAYEKSNSGFMMIDGEIYEKPHIDKMKKEQNDSKYFVNNGEKNERNRQ